MYTEVILTNLERKLEHLPSDDATMLEINNAFARYMDPYVPMDTGALSQANVTPEYVEYATPYAHYQYTGVVYGPNIPITKDGIIVGWFSRPNVKKTPTGVNLNYSTEKHPLATHHWDQAMMRDRGYEFTEEVSRIIARHLNNDGR